MNYNLRHIPIKTSRFTLRASSVLSFLFFLFSIFSSAQVKSSIDSTKIKIGEQITYKIEVEADTTDLVVFPEGQTFTPLEMIESYKPDTTRNQATYNLVKKYGLTQFDSGHYTIPRQKIIIGSKEYFTDSLRVEVNNVLVDSTKQGLYDIKPFIKVDKSRSDWWKTALIIIAILAVVAFLMYWFIWRKKPLTEAEEIALLPPYERAKMALQKLDESDYLQQAELKGYYSELTFIIRRYLDEQVYDRALESTTDELINRLNLLKDGNQIELSKNDIRNIETILKRADLVKFAKVTPDIELAKIDRDTVDLEIDNVKQALPEPTEEEKLRDQQYKEMLERKKKRRKIIITVAVSLFLILATFVGFSVKYGFDYVKDTIIGHESKTLLEGDWVTSEYGIPPIYISTPVVLERVESKAIDTISNAKTTMFSYGTLLSSLNIAVSTSRLNIPDSASVDLNMAIEGGLRMLEQNNVKDIITKREKFVTPNAAEGLKVFGTASFPGLLPDQYRKGKYVFLAFTAQNILQQVILVWDAEDRYAEEIMERVLNSVELKKVE
ncbi:BatD family protein [Gelidibacter japonicus]|uniref:BatD family protein n=1 Tax=Gelidibacter japonicus TaxID=1962232 RepID=UPI0020207EBA|nr:BatD family protein [Gelidibacter japonicus]MCL8008571.1 BatD family protein [Gelidibacter japonicus]